MTGDRAGDDVSEVHPSWCRCRGCGGGGGRLFIPGEAVVRNATAAPSDPSPSREHTTDAPTALRPQGAQ